MNAPMRPAAIAPAPNPAGHVDVVNFGCRLNIAEGEAVRRAAAGATNRDTVIFNSCAVTAEAERQLRQAIRRTARERPGARIIVTGCAAETSAAALAAMPEVSALVGNRTKTDPAGWTPGGMPAAELFRPVVSGATHARAFVAVQNGCDHHCTFCIIPSGRGPSRSASIADVVAAAAAAVARGQQEVVLTGVDLTSWGGDVPGEPRLGALVAAILREVPDLPRLRLSTLDPAAIDPQLFELLTGEPRVMPHVHLSIQAGHDMILKRMRRRHDRADALALTERLAKQRPDIAIGADLIAGFPTEDDSMFADTMALIDDCAIRFGHIFPYSPRPGTPAARMPQVAESVARGRAATLRARCQASLMRWLDALVGTRQTMLVERDGRRGHADNFAPITLEQPAMPGAIIPVRITARDGERLSAMAEAA